MKNILVSGASRGIGKAIVIKFANEGWNVAFCSRNETNLKALQQEINILNPNVKAFYKVCDVENQNEVKAFAEAAQNEFRHFDILVNNAGTFIQGNIHDLSDEDFNSMMQINLHSAFTLTKALVGNMKSNKKGHIFNMSSIAGYLAYPNGGAYNVSKHALTGFSKTLRDELKEFGIRVSTIYPGATLTDSWAGADIPEERFMKPEDIAQTIFDIYNLSERTVVEDIVLRPQLGDI